MDNNIISVGQSASIDAKEAQLLASQADILPNHISSILMIGEAINWSSRMGELPTPSIGPPVLDLLLGSRDESRQLLEVCDHLLLGGEVNLVRLRMIVREPFRRTPHGEHDGLGVADEAPCLGHSMATHAR